MNSQLRSARQHVIECEKDVAEAQLELDDATAYTPFGNNQQCEELQQVLIHQKIANLAVASHKCKWAKIYLEKVQADVKEIAVLREIEEEKRKALELSSAVTILESNGYKVAKKRK